MTEVEPNEPIAVDSQSTNVKVPTTRDDEKTDSKEAGGGTEAEETIATDELFTASVEKPKSPLPEKIDPVTGRDCLQEQDQSAIQKQDDCSVDDKSVNSGGWSWLASGATDLLSTFKQEVSTVAVGVQKAVKNTVKEVREDIHEMSQDLKSMLLDEGEVKKDSKKCEIAVKRLNLIDKRTTQLRLLVEDLVTFRSILSTKQKSLKTFLVKRRIGGQPIVDACHELAQSIEDLDSRHTSQDNTLDAKILTPLGIVRERIQISRDLYVQYNQKKQVFEQVAGQWRKSQLQDNGATTQDLNRHQEAFNNAVEALETAETDFVESIKNLQKFIETNVADKFHEGAEELLPAVKDSNDESLDEADADLLNALEAESSAEEGTQKSDVNDDSVAA